jgi:enoyl-[acyl-carrier protein] reductase I
LLQGKTIIVSGVTNERSIAWGVAKTLDAQGARIIFSYRLDRSKENIEKLSPSLTGENHIIMHCDVEKDESIDQFFNEVSEKCPVIHGLVHSIAFANKEDLSGDYSNVSREGFLFAHDVSAYSLTAMSRGVRPLMTEGGSIVTQSYIGAERAKPNYNIMGVAKASLEASVKYLAVDLGVDNIRVNAVSAGPIRTLAAKGISSFNDSLREMEEKAPLKRNVTQEEVANTTLYLLSHLSSGVTGETIHVDAGYHIL